MSMASSEERALAQLLVGALNLEPPPEPLDRDAPLFGTAPGSWGLDSIDALEIALAVQKQYGVELRSDDPGVREAFASLAQLSAYVEQRRQ